MPYVTEWVENELFIEHQDIRIYHVYKDDDLSAGARTYLFTTDPNGFEGGEASFDIRDIISQLKKNQRTPKSVTKHISRIEEGTAEPNDYEGLFVEAVSQGLISPEATDE
jgi:hypothetical protein